MKRLPWGLNLLLLSIASAHLVFTGCGSESDAINDGNADGGDEASSDSSAGPDSTSGNSDGSSTSDAGGDGASSDGSFVDVVTDGASRAETSVCKDVGVACTTSNECCSASCDPNSGKCATPVGCSLPGVACSTGNQCCTGSCVNNVCANVACVADNGACVTNTDCCGQTCTPDGKGGGTCTPLGTKPTAGNPCTTNTQCASGYCNNGVCANPSPICTVTGDICSSDNQCCGGLCSIASGATVGVCKNVAASGGTVGGPCLPAGELCSPNGTCTGAACCSRSCAPSPTSGMGVCQPESGCHMIGDLCSSTSECCGVKNLPGSIKGGGGGPSTDVQCQKAPGQAFGVCNYVSTVCSPAGALCKPGNATTGGAMSCSTKTDCCAGNDNQYPTCQLDANGIPRCTVTNNLSCSGSPPPGGTQCASSADCCGTPCVLNTDPGTSASKPYVCTGTKCQQQGTTCTSNADCCTGLPCAIPPGGAYGICGGTVLTDGGVSDAAPPNSDGGVVQPPTDGGTTSGDGGSGTGDGGSGTTDSGTTPPPTCALYGQTCTVDANCCSGVPCTAGFCRYP